MNAVLSMLQWILPLLVALIVIVAMFANFSGTITKFRQGDAATLSLVLISILMVAYGVERYVNSTQLDQRLTNIESKLSTAVGGQFINNSNDIYVSAAKLLDEFEGRIRTIVVTTVPKAPDSFAERIAQKLKERRDKGFPIKYDVVLILSAEQVRDLDKFEKATNDRISYFDQYGVADAINLNILETNTTANFDVFIVDRKSVHIGYSLSKDGRKSDNGIIYENQPQLASSLADWFDSSVLPLAKPWKEWVKEQRNKRKAAA
jgi:Flp pilus assembly pilin Flp